jgi:hypothetical protein
MTTTQAGSGSQSGAFDRILVDLGFGLLTWGFRRAELRQARAEASARVAADAREQSAAAFPPSERAATERMIHSHFGIR